VPPGPTRRSSLRERRRPGALDRFLAGFVGDDAIYVSSSAQGALAARDQFNITALLARARGR
jgi:hypothetical protein